MNKIKDSYLRDCQHCGDTFFTNDVKEENGRFLCKNCLQKRIRPGHVCTINLEV